MTVWDPVVEMGALFAEVTEGSPFREGVEPGEAELIVLRSGALDRRDGGDLAEGLGRGFEARTDAEGDFDGEVPVHGVEVDL